MGIFNLFKKKENKKMANLDEMLRELSDSEKKELHAKLQDLYKAEDEREIDKIEREKADGSEKKDEKLSEERDESKEIGKDVDELEEKIKDEKAEDEKDEAEEAHEETQNERHDNTEARLKALEDGLGEIKEILSNLGKTSVEEKANDVYGIGKGVFQGDEKSQETKKMSAQEIAGILNKLKR